MIFSNSGGLITRGFGCDSRVLTRGYGGQIDIAGSDGIVYKEVCENIIFDITAPLIKEDNYTNQIKIPLLVKEKLITMVKAPLIILEEMKKKITVEVNNKRYKLIQKILDIL